MARRAHKKYHFNFSNKEEMVGFLSEVKKSLKEIEFALEIKMNSVRVRLSGTNEQQKFAIRKLSEIKVAMGC
jgi:hypothetical protein